MWMKRNKLIAIYSNMTVCNVTNNRSAKLYISRPNLPPGRLPSLPNNYSLQSVLGCILYLLE